MRWLERFSFKKREEISRTTKNVSMQRRLLVGVLSFASACDLPDLLEAENTSEEPLESGGTTQIKDPNCYLGCPTGGNVDHKTIRREHYTLNNNSQTKFYNWIAKCSTDRHWGDIFYDQSGAVWEADPDLPENERLEPEDYGGNKKIINMYGARPSHPESYVSTIIPMKPTTAKIFDKFKARESELSKKYPKVCLVSGTLYEKTVFGLGKANEKYKVPSHIWHVVIVRNTREQIKTAAFIMPQDMKKRGRYCDTQVSIDEVERRAGLDLFPDMKDEEENKVEALEHGELAEDLGCRGKSKSKKKPKKPRRKR